MWKDLKGIRDQVGCIWSSYKTGDLDLAAAAIATDAAIDLAKNLIDEVLPVLKPHHIGQLAGKFCRFLKCLTVREVDVEVANGDGREFEKHNASLYDAEVDAFETAY